MQQNQPTDKGGEQQQRKEKVKVYVKILTDTANRVITLETVNEKIQDTNENEQKEEQKKLESRCGVMNISKGKDLIYKAIKEIEANKAGEKLSLSAKTISCYMGSQVLADLQFHNFITIISTEDDSNKEAYGIKITFKCK